MIQIYLFTPLFAILAVVFFFYVRKALRSNEAVVDGVEYRRSNDGFLYWFTIAAWSFAMLVAMGCALVGLWLIASDITGSL